MSNRRTICALNRKNVFKAEEMLQRMGINAQAWRETVSKRRPHSTVTRDIEVPAASYLSTGLSSAYKKHVLDERCVEPIVLRVLGGAHEEEIERFQKAIKPRPTPTKEENPFSVGQSAWVGELPCTIASLEGDLCNIAIELIGKLHVSVIHYSRLRPG